MAELRNPIQAAPRKRIFGYWRYPLHKLRPYLIYTQQVTWAYGIGVGRVGIMFVVKGSTEETVAWRASLSRRGDEEGVTGEPAPAQAPAVTTASDPIAGSDAGEQPVASSTFDLGLCQDCHHPSAAHVDPVDDDGEAPCLRENCGCPDFSVAY